MTTLVVARHNEPLDWLADVPEHWTVYVYNKGEPLPSAVSRDRLWERRRENIGREAETFCYHNRTVTPGGYTVYLQGNPFDHCPDPIATAQWIMARGDRVGWLGPHYDTTWNVHPHRLEDLGMEAVWNELFPFRPLPHRFSFPAGAQMVVWRTGVLNRDAEFWRDAHRIASTDDWRVAHCFERLWPTIYEVAT